MRILRLRLRNYRGVEEREVAFAPSGVTIVSGPNEVGKSSLAEAIDLLFDERADTTKQRVRDVLPVDRDVGAEVEADVETGPYAFTYAKRFCRRPRTSLALRSPRIEQVTGREAHQRVRAILEETIDTALWRALRVQQGGGLAQPSFEEHPALLAALDRAAGAAHGSGEETGEPAPSSAEATLFEAAEQECLRYFTPTGRERATLSRAAHDALEARRRADATGEELAKLAADVARAEELARLRAAAQHAVREAEQTLRACEERVEPIAALRDARARADADLRAASAELREAAQLARQRSQLATVHAAAEAEVAQRGEEMEHGEPALLGARAELEHAERAFAAAQAAEAEAARTLAAHRDALEAQRAEQELDRLRERRRRIADAEHAIAETDAEIAAVRLTEATVQRIRDAERAVERARTRVETEGPRIRLTPAVALEATLDGEPVVLEAGQVVERRVAESLSLSVPGLADLSLVADAGAAERMKVLEQARSRFQERCAEAGVLDHADAVRRLAGREQALRRQREQRALRDELLAGTSPEQLDARIRALDARTRDHEVERGTLFPLATDALQAAEQLAASETAHDHARRARSEGERRRDALRERHRQLADQHRETAVRLELALQRFQDLSAQLASAREEVADEALQERREELELRETAAAARVRDATEQLAALEPERAESELERARRERERTERELSRVHDEATAVAARLALRGEAGLYERHAAESADADRAERHARGLARRAAAARCLRDTLREERDAARDGYAEPLARRIEALGRRVFGADLAVELDDALRVERRVQDGRSLHLDQLSAGAREQIALLARLAVATLVADDGGAPLVIDDALGHSDAERLVRIGQALSEAAPALQVIVLTCTPERYRHVENARAVRLA